VNAIAAQPGNCPRSRQAVLAGIHNFESENKGSVFIGIWIVPLLVPAYKGTTLTTANGAQWGGFSSVSIPAQSYAEGLGRYSIPRNWVVSVEGKLTFEGLGFGSNGEEWMSKTKEMLRKVKGTTSQGL